MPSNLLAIDTNFPTFTGEEPVEEQIRQLVNYLYQLRESLQYSLQNLSKENFNATALDQLTKEASQEIVNQMQKIWNTLSRLDVEIKALQGRISESEKAQELLEIWSIQQEKVTEEHSERLRKAEESISDLENTSEEINQRVLEAEEGIGELQGACIRSIEIVEV